MANCSEKELYVAGLQLDFFYRVMKVIISFTQIHQPLVLKKARLECIKRFIIVKHLMKIQNFNTDF